jgi:hypothetical protein
MKTVIAALLLAATAFGQPRLMNARLETRNISGPIESEFAKSSGAAWFGYAVPVVPGDRTSCCYYTVKGASLSGCRLEGEAAAAPLPPARPTGPIRLESSGELHVLYRVENGVVSRIRSFTGDCELDAGGLPVVWLTGVTPASSLALLDTYVRTTELSKPAAAAISLHSDPAADAYLEKYMAVSQPEALRRHVAFLLGSMRGARGFETLKRIVADTNQGDRVRESALHGLSVVKAPEATGYLVDVAKSDPVPRIRGQALFWLAQKAGREAAPAIRQAIDNDPEARVKDRAVFALSQLPNGEGVPLLMDVARNNRNPEVRKKAIFWLGQSKDPRAAKFFEELPTR